MKKILFIFVSLIMAASLLGQDTTYTYKIVKDRNGRLSYSKADKTNYQSYFTVSEIPDTINYEYADPDSVEIIHVINFDQYTASENPLIADIEAGMPYGGYIGLADTADYTTFAELVDYDGEGDVILMSKYLEGWGCYEHATGCDSSGGGILWRENINPTFGERDTIYVTVVAYFEDNFALGDGLKMPGAYNSESGARDARSMRTMLKTTGDADDDKLTYLFYDYGFDNASDPDNSAKPSLGAASGYGDYPDTLRMGEWVSITIQLHSGNANSYDALHAVYINDTCVSYRSSLMVNNGVDGTAYFDILDISTFPGGNDNSYTMPVTTNMYIKTVTMWKEKYADMYSTPAYQRVIKLPKETEWDPDLRDPSTTPPNPDAPTVNELMGRGFCAADITTNNGTGDFLWTDDELDDLQAAGVDNLRAVFWYFNDMGSAPWTITPSVLTNLAAMIDSVNAHDMIFILDHHQPMMKRNNLYTTANMERFLSHWAQIAEYCDTRFDSTELVYELLNEPEYSATNPNSQMTAGQWNVMCQAAVDSIRVYDTEKSIMVTPHGWSKIEYLDDFVMPTDPSDRLILSIHYYDPKWATTQGGWTSEQEGWLYNDWPNIWPFKMNLVNDFQVLEDWLDDNGNPPVTIGEWGSINGTSRNPERYNYALMLANFFDDMGYSASWWDFQSSAHWFEVYDDATGTWDDSMKNAILTDVIPEFDYHDSTEIYQSDFSVDVGTFTQYVQDGGAVTLTSNGSQLVCTVTNGGNSTDDVQIRTSHTATKDSIYRISYTISGDKSFCADKLNDQFSWHNIEALSGGGTYSRVYTYEMAYPTDGVNYVSFLIGGSTGVFYIDDVLIERISLLSDPAPPVAYTILWEEDFDDFAVQSTLNSDTLEAHIDNFESASSTGGDGVYETAGIVNFDGSHVIESRYPIGECCLEGNGWGSTGMDWRAYITADEESSPNPPRRLVMSLNAYLDPLFENSEGFKFPALCTEKGNGWDNGTIRIMVVDWSLHGNLEPQFYTHAYWNGYDNAPITNGHTKTQDPDSWIPRGEWFNMALVVDAGYNRTDGWSELFINRELIDANPPQSDTEDPLPFISDGDVAGLTYIEFTTFMGGSSAGYVSPRTQYMYIDDVIIYYLDDERDYTYPSVPGDSIYLPPEANWPR